MTPAQLLRIMPKAGRQADLFTPHIMATAKRYQINTPARLASFLAQIGIESMQLNRTSESLNYSTPARLMEVWPKRFPSLLSTVGYTGNAIKLANKVYAGRMGNGDEASGDGYKYRGRGLIQLTGRDNYEACGAALGYNLIDNPPLVESPAVACQSAGWFWDKRNLNKFADYGDQVLITQRVNGGVHGLAERKAMFEIAMRVLA